MDELIIGAFYEKPNGEIVKIFYGNNKGIYKYNKLNKFNLVTHISQCQKWKMRGDLRDYPNNPNPTLPYCFDLFFDIKTMDGLKDEISKLRELEKMAKENHIEV